MCFEVEYPKGVFFYCPITWTLPYVPKTVLFFFPLSFCCQSLRLLLLFQTLLSSWPHYSLHGVFLFPWAVTGQSKEQNSKTGKINWKNIPFLTLTLSSAVEIPQAKVTRGRENIVKQQHYTLLLPGDTAAGHRGTAQVGFALGSPA